MSRRKRYTRNLGRVLPAPLAVETIEWIRFEHAREPYGIFSYVKDARERLSEELREELGHLVDWFDDFLAAPELAEDAAERFWFRAEATMHVTRARRIAELVRAAGIPVVERRSAWPPGRRTFMDGDQVAVVSWDRGGSGRARPTAAA